MNRIHRVVFNQALNSWQAVSETARGRTRGAGGGGRPAVLRLLRGGTALVAAGAMAGLAFAGAGGAGGDPYPGPAYNLNAGGGGADGQGGTGGYNDSSFNSYGGSGGGASLAGDGQAGAPGNGGSWSTDVGAGGAGGAGAVLSEGGAGANGGADAGNGYGGGGGGGGSGYTSSGSTTSLGDPRGAGAGGRGGDGAWGAGGGGAGGHSLVVPSGGASLLTVQSTGVLTGGAGGAGGNSSAQAGGGGGGGAAVYFSGNEASSVSNAGTLTGGAGGNGGTLIGSVWANGPSGGGGGGGGSGLTLIGGALTNQAGGAITGGAGGTGGANAVGTRGGTVVNGLPGGGGGGGDGVNATLTNQRVTNAGTITGGAGGTGGASVVAGVANGAAGAGGEGVRITGDGNTLVNAGSIAGGLSGDGSSRANAVSFTGNGNTLELNAGYGFTGNAVATGTGNTLRLGGTVNASFDVAGIGSLYQGFTGYAKSGSGTWVLSGATSAVTPWTVTGGTLSIASDASLGDAAGALTLDGGALQATASTASSRPVVLGAAGGTVSPGAGGTLSWNGAVSGAGGLTKTGAGTLVLTAANTHAGGTALKGGTLAVGHSTALGSGGLSMDDGTTLAFAADGLTVANPIRLTGSNDPTFDTGSFTATLSGGIAGAAEVTKTGSGTLILGAANNTYTGATTVAQGTWRAGATNAFSSTSATTVASGATLDLAGYSQVLASVNNSGTVSLVGSAPGTLLTVNGPWAGNGGTLVLGTQLGIDGSATDRLLLNGASAVASGSTGIRIVNLNGLGGWTTGNGIEIVSTANGGRIAGGAFSLAAPVSAGAYDYRLETTPTAAYLRNTAPVAPVLPVTPGTPVSPTVPGAPVAPVSPVAPAVPGTPVRPLAPVAPAVPAAIPTYRAEVPLYAALPEQLRQAGHAMLGNMHQRAGDERGAAGAADAADPKGGEHLAWGRVMGIDRDIGQSGGVSPHSQGRLTGFQAGTDLWASPRWRTGIYVGQLDGDMRVSGFARGFVNYAAGANDLRSQYLGAYATWKSGTGFYLDGVLQAGRHRYTVNPTLAMRSGGKGGSLLASLEVGQTFHLAPNWVIEPQLQLVHQKLNLDETALVGARVRQDSSNGWMARAGVRVQGEIQTGAGTVQPYVRLNVYKRGSGTDVARFTGPAGWTDIATRTGGTSGELAAGATWPLSQRTSVYGEIGKLWTSGGGARTRSGLAGSVGVKARW